MAEEKDNDALKTEELRLLLGEIRDRVRARYPAPPGGGAAAAVADLSALVHARDAAEAKVAAIGSVNPRPPGPLNAFIQLVKRTIARGLDWFVRDQVVFNRQIMACVESTIEALNDVNRALVEVKTLRDMHANWQASRAEWERKQAANEIQFLRSVADLQTAFQHRATLMETNFRDIVKSQHADYLGALDRANLDIQKRLWADLDGIRTEYEALIHNELRTARQRAGYLAQMGGAALHAPASGAQAPPQFDSGRLADRFRGTEEYVKTSQRFYVPYFAGCKEILDIGCGRGEFLELLREAGTPGRGIDLSPESAGLCRRKGLQAEVAELFTYLDKLADASLGGIFCAQVVEHIDPYRVPEMIRLAAAKLTRGGVFVIETPNPECLAIFSTHFYLDPTHARPVPQPLLAFYMQECGLGRLESHYRSPAVESLPSLGELPENFRNAFFGGLDYAVIGRKLT